VLAGVRRVTGRGAVGGGVSGKQGYERFPTCCRRYTIWPRCLRFGRGGCGHFSTLPTARELTWPTSRNAGAVRIAALPRRRVALLRARTPE